MLLLLLLVALSLFLGGRLVWLGREKNNEAFAAVGL